MRTRPQLAAPDLELLFAPVLFEEEGLKQPTEDGLTLGVVLLQPKSSGTVMLRSADPLDLAGDRPALSHGSRRRGRAHASPGPSPRAPSARAGAARGATSPPSSFRARRPRRTRRSSPTSARPRRRSTTRLPRAGWERIRERVVDPRAPRSRHRGTAHRRRLGDAAAAERPHELADGDDRGARGGAHRRCLGAGRVSPAATRGERRDGCRARAVRVQPKRTRPVAPRRARAHRRSRACRRPRTDTGTSRPTRPGQACTETRRSG